MPLLSIIIVSWNVCDLLAECLSSLDADGIFNWAQVLIVDNLSSDGTVEMIRKQFPQVQLIIPEFNLGYARGSNLGIARSSGEYIYLLNPDTVVHPGGTRALVDFLRAHPEYGVVGPLQYDGNGIIRFDAATALPTTGNVITDLTNISGLFPNAQILPNRKLTYWDHKDDRDVPGIAGSAMLLPRPVIECVGMLDDTMFIIEDMDLCRRVTDAGWKIRYLASASIIHYGGQSLSKRGAPDSYIQIAFQSFWLYLRKHNGSLPAFTMVVVVMISSIVASVIFGSLKMLGVVRASLHYRTARAVFHWTLCWKSHFTHDLAAPLKSSFSKQSGTAS